MAVPELHGAEGGDVEGDWRCVTFWGCFWCVPLVGLGCVVAMTVGNSTDDYGWAIAILWGVLACMMCCTGILIWSDSSMETRQRTSDAFVGGVLFSFMWPLLLLNKCGARFAKFFLPPKSDEVATHERTIVFEGKVLPGRATVCSWPGKYLYPPWELLFFFFFKFFGY